MDVCGLFNLLLSYNLGRTAFSYFTRSHKKKDIYILYIYIKINMRYQVLQKRNTLLVSSSDSDICIVGNLVLIVKKKRLVFPIQV